MSKYICSKEDIARRCHRKAVFSNNVAYRGQYYIVCATNDQLSAIVAAMVTGLRPIHFDEEPSRKVAENCIQLNLFEALGTIEFKSRFS